MFMDEWGTDGRGVAVSGCSADRAGCPRSGVQSGTMAARQPGTAVHHRSLRSGSPRERGRLGKLGRTARVLPPPSLPQSCRRRTRAGKRRALRSVQARGKAQRPCMGAAFAEPGRPASSHAGLPAARLRTMSGSPSPCRPAHLGHWILPPLRPRYPERQGIGPCDRRKPAATGNRPAVAHPLPSNVKRAAGDRGWVSAFGQSREGGHRRGRAWPIRLSAAMAAPLASPGKLREAPEPAMSTVCDHPISWRIAVLATRRPIVRPSHRAGQPEAGFVSGDRSEPAAGRAPPCQVRGACAGPPAVPLGSPNRNKPRSLTSGSRPSTGRSTSSPGNQGAVARQPVLPDLMLGRDHPGPACPMRPRHGGRETVETGRLPPCPMRPDSCRNEAVRLGRGQAGTADAKAVRSGCCGKRGAGGASSANPAACLFRRSGAAVGNNTMLLLGGKAV